MPLSRTFTVFALVAGTVAQLQADWTIDRSLRVPAVGSVIPSPDGLLVAYTQTRLIIEEERSEQVSQIYLAKTDGSMQRQLTWAEKSATSPSFSADGHFVYFQSARSGQPNIWRIPVDGGEAQRVTDW